MPRFIRRAGRPNHSLLNRTYGTAARTARDTLGASQDARVEALLERVDRLERELAFGHRHFKGFLVGDNRIRVVPDLDGWLRVYSNDDSVLIDRNPNKLTSVLDLTVPAACACCPEDTTYVVSILGTTCIEGAMGYNAETCTLTLTLNVDEACLCDACGPGGG